MEERQTLVEVASGKVELVWNGVYSTLQFNAACTDVVHLCKGMCCRLRQGFTVLLRADEVGKFESKPYPRDASLHVLQTSPDGNACFYLEQEKSLCKIHGKAPQMCQDYHCSPEGKGDGVKYRDGGWLWTPMGCLGQLADGSVFDMRKQKVNLK